MGKPNVCSFREEHKNEAAIIFIHGFSGDSKKTWGIFPSLICKEKALKSWDVFSVGYTTSLLFDISSIWAADPPLDRIAGYFNTLVDLPPFDKYKALVLVAHSMGGVVVQRALVDNEDLVDRTSHLLLFGAPSAGLIKASLFARLKRSIRDMASGSVFIKDIRRRWNKQFGKKIPFHFLAVAGDRDEFVSTQSSLSPFPAKCQRVIAGDHLEIVKPQDSNHMGFKLLLNALSPLSATAVPVDTARLALETREFAQVIKILWPKRNKLDTEALGRLAMALDSSGRREDAIQILSDRPGKSTDLLGILAGRLKRRWLLERSESDAEKSLQLYTEGYQRAVAVGDHCQAFYHVINIAFLELAFGGKPIERLKELAQSVLYHCEQARQAGHKDHWVAAAEGEAFLLMNRRREALDCYRSALHCDPLPSPREISSMYQQATLILGLTGSRQTCRELEKLFSDVM